MHFKNLSETFEFFDKHNDISQKNFSQFMSDLRRYENNYKENVDSILRLFDKYRSFIRRKKINPKTDAFFHDFDIILKTWQDTENPNSIVSIKNNLLRPLKEHCTQIDEDVRSNEILPIVIKANYAHDDIVHIRELYSKIFTQVIEKIKQKKEKLNITLQFFYKNKA
jgi:hypothetical protein